MLHCLLYSVDACFFSIFIIDHSSSRIKPYLKWISCCISVIWLIEVRNSSVRKKKALPQVSFLLHKAIYVLSFYYIVHQPIVCIATLFSWMYTMCNEHISWINCFAFLCSVFGSLLIMVEVDNMGCFF